MNIELSKLLTSNDVIYVDATIYNRENNLIGASFSETFNSAIVSKPNEYYLAIARFAISHMSVPLYFFKENYYSVTIDNTADNGNISQIFLNYVPTGAYTQFTNNPVFYYQQVVEMINNALATAHINAAVAGDPPFIKFENDEKFTLFLPESNYVPNSADRPRIYFNAALFQQFQFFRSFFNGYNAANGAVYEIVQYELEADQNLVNFGGDDYYFYRQERKALYLFNEIQNIVFTTRTLPVEREIIGASAGGGRLITLPILASFVPDLSVGRDLSEYQFYANGNYSLINLKSESSLNTIDFDVNIQTRDGLIFNLFLEPTETVNVKFAFLKKSLYNNQFSALTTF